MALLPELRPSVLDVANRIGCESAGAFARSCRAVTGETPSGYRRRIGVT